MVVYYYCRIDLNGKDYEDRGSLKRLLIKLLISGSDNNNNRNTSNYGVYRLKTTFTPLLAKQGNEGEAALSGTDPSHW